MSKLGLSLLCVVAGLILCLMAHSGEADLLGTVKKIGEVITAIDQLKEQLYKATGDEGSIKVQGRTLHYKVKGGFHKWEYKYKGEAWDTEAGISVKSKGWKSASGAREHALEDLVAELKKLGLLK